MAWNIVKVERNGKSRGMPSASVGHGRIGINVSACNLLDDYEKYNCVELLTDPDRPYIVGICFLEESTKTSVQIKRKKIDGKVVGGIDIASKSHVEKLFGVAGTQSKTTNYSITKEEDNILVIHIK